MIKAMRRAAQKQVSIAPDKFKSDALVLHFLSCIYALYFQPKGHIGGLCIQYCNINIQLLKY